jgi:hypothetical protein
MANARTGAPNAHIHPLMPPPAPLLSRSHDVTGEQYAPRGETAYVMLPSREPVEASEYEDPLLEAVEVTVLWGGTVLHVAHLAPPRPFYVGHGDGVDYLLPVELAPFARAAIVELDGGARPVAPAGAVLAGDEVRFGEVTFRVARVTAGKRTPRAVGTDARGLGGAFLGSLASVAAFLGALAYYTPALGASLDGDFDRDRVDAMRVYLNAQAERERERQVEQGDKSAAAEGGGTPGEAARGAEGKMGRPDRPAVHKRTAVAGGGELTLSREQALTEARTIGMIGLLNTMNGRALPTALWGADVATGPDASDAWGELFGKEPGESGGLGGIGLSGAGSGGGGLGKGIGIGAIGGCNPLCGDGPGRFGLGIGRSGGGHHTQVPRLTPAGVTIASGHLPPEVIQRIVRQNYGRFRGCYESGLGANPNLSGRVTARFIIDRDGAVSNAANGGSDLPDSKVVSCVLSQFYGISFPPPENGIVTVSYPIMFTPG